MLIKRFLCFELLFLLVVFLFDGKQIMADDLYYDLDEYSLSNCKVSLNTCINGYLQAASNSTQLCDSGSFAECSIDRASGQRGVADVSNDCTCVKPKGVNATLPPVVSGVDGCICQSNRVIVNECKVGFIATCASRTDQPACACYTPEVAAVEGRKDTSFFCDTVAGLDTGVESALGCIPMDMNKFAAWFLQFIFGIAGAIAFLLMVYGFILMATSSGDEKKVQGARETVTSAITGLLVSIFALFIFRLIAVNILHIPGLN